MIQLGYIFKGRGLIMNLLLPLWTNVCCYFVKEVHFYLEKKIILISSLFASHGTWRLIWCLTEPGNYAPLHVFQVTIYIIKELPKISKFGTNEQTFVKSEKAKTLRSACWSRECVPGQLVRDPPLAATTQRNPQLYCCFGSSSSEEMNFCRICYDYCYFKLLGWLWSPYQVGSSHLGSHSKPVSGLGLFQEIPNWFMLPPLQIIIFCWNYHPWTVLINL